METALPLNLASHLKQTAITIWRNPRDLEKMLEGPMGSVSVSIVLSFGEKNPQKPDLMGFLVSLRLFQQEDQNFYFEGLELEKAMAKATELWKDISPTE